MSPGSSRPVRRSTAATPRRRRRALRGRHRYVCLVRSRHSWPPSLAKRASPQPAPPRPWAGASDGDWPIRAAEYESDGWLVPPSGSKETPARLHAAARRQSDAALEASLAPVPPSWTPRRRSYASLHLASATLRVRRLAGLRTACGGHGAREKLCRDAGGRLLRGATRSILCPAGESRSRHTDNR